MKRTWILAIPLLVVMVLLIGMGAGACDGGGGGEVTPPPGDEEEEEEEEEEVTPASPTPGEWTASTGCSEFTFTFTVSPDGIAISEMSCSFREFKCGPRTVTAPGATFKRSPPWSITGGQFTVETSMGDWGIAIQGRFDETGRHASGTWEISAEGITCQAGTWESAH